MLKYSKFGRFIGLCSLSLCITICLQTSAYAGGRKKTQLEGDWTLGCDNGTDSSLIIRENNMTADTQIYADENCEEGVIKVTLTGVFLLGEKFESDDGVKVREIDINVFAGSLTPLNQLWVDQLNTNATCGKTDWTIGESGLIDNECFGENVIGPAFQIVKRNGKKLFFGDAGQYGDLSEPDNRPTQLDLEKEYHKVK